MFDLSLPTFSPSLRYGHSRFRHPRLHPPSASPSGLVRLRAFARLLDSPACCPLVRFRSPCGFVWRAHPLSRGSAGLTRLGCGSSITTLIHRSGSNGPTSDTSTRSTSFVNFTTPSNDAALPLAGLAARSRAVAGRWSMRFAGGERFGASSFSTKSELRLRRTDVAVSVRTSLRRQHQNVSAFVGCFPAIADGRHHFASAPAAACVRSSLRRRHPLQLRDDHHPLRSAIQADVSAASLPPTPGASASEVQTSIASVKWRRCASDARLSGRGCAIHGFANIPRASMPYLLGGSSVSGSNLVRFGQVCWWFNRFPHWSAVPIRQRSRSLVIQPAFVLENLSVIKT